MPAKPKKSCCVSRPRCGRCPIRMLAEGRMPVGYTVKRRKLVRVPAVELVEPAAGRKLTKKQAKKAVKRRQRGVAAQAKAA